MRYIAFAISARKSSVSRILTRLKKKKKWGHKQKATSRTYINIIRNSKINQGKQTLEEVYWQLIWMSVV